MMISHLQLLALLMAPVATFTGAAVLLSNVELWNRKVKRMMSKSAP